MTMRRLWFAATFWLGAALAGAAAAQPAYGPGTYFGAPSEQAADRAALAPLNRRFLAQPYGQVRQQLIALGWRPVALRPIPKGRRNPCPESLFPPDFPERLACSGVEYAGEAFLFRRPHSRLYAVVTTYGEENIRVNTIRSATRDDLLLVRLHPPGPE